MNVFVILLAVIGLVLLILLGIGTLVERSREPASDDPATPYREGLHAAIRMQRVAQDLEQQLYTEAARQLGAAGEPASGQSTSAPGQSAGEA